MLDSPYLQPSALIEDRWPCKRLRMRHYKQSQWVAIAVQRKWENVLAHLLYQPVVLEALVDRHLALGFTLLLNDLFDVFLVLGRRRALCLLLLRLLSFSVLPGLLLGTLLLGLLLGVCVLVCSVILLLSRGMVILAVSNEIWNVRCGAH